MKAVAYIRSLSKLFSSFSFPISAQFSFTFAPTSFYSRVTILYYIILYYIIYLSLALYFSFSLRSLPSSRSIFKQHLSFLPRFPLFFSFTLLTLLSFSWNRCSLYKVFSRHFSSLFPHSSFFPPSLIPLFLSRCSLAVKKVHIVTLWS